MHKKRNCQILILTTIMIITIYTCAWCQSTNQPLVSGSGVPTGSPLPGTGSGSSLPHTVGGASPAPPNQADDKPFSSKLSIDRNRIKIGDQINLTIETKTPKDFSVASPDPKVFLKDFELLNTKKPLINEEGENRITIFQYLITVFSTGKKAIGPVELESKRIQDGSGENIVKAGEINIFVESVLPKDKDAKNLQIRDIKPPVQVNYPNYYYLIGALVILLICLLIFLTVKHIIKKMRKIDETAGYVYRSPEEIADLRLKALKESSMVKDGKIKEYYIELSEIIRQYIEGRYTIFALDMTTTELYRELKSSKIKQSAVGDIKKLLSYCDLVKFAKLVPPEDRFSGDFDEASRIIQEIKPVIQKEIEEAQRPTLSGKA